MNITIPNAHNVIKPRWVADEGNIVRDRWAARNSFVALNGDDATELAQLLNAYQNNYDLALLALDAAGAKSQTIFPVPVASAEEPE